jgi:uncharacterized phiE125 gp8 family phage protein
MSDDSSRALRLITPPAQEPATLAQAKLFLRIEHSADDDSIARALTAARQAAEQYLRFALLPQTWDYAIANPCGLQLPLPFGPAESVTSVTLTNEAAASTLMNAANYRLSVDGFHLHFSNPPSIEKLVVRYVAASAATAADVPAAIVQGILHHVAVMMENRDGVAAMPTQSAACYQPYRRVML